MADKSLSSVVGGGGGLVKLAPDLTFPSSLSAGVGYASVTKDTTTGGLVELKGASEKSALLFFQLDSVPTESITIKLTIDGVVIWNDTFIAPSTSLLLVGNNLASSTSADSFQCDSSYSLEMTSTTGGAVVVKNLVRPLA